MFKKEFIYLKNITGRLGLGSTVVKYSPYVRGLTGSKYR